MQIFSKRFTFLLVTVYNFTFLWVWYILLRLDRYSKISYIRILLHEHWIEFPSINIFFYSRWLNGPSRYAALFLALSVIKIIVCIRTWVYCSFLKISLIIINLYERIYYTTSHIASNIKYSFSIMQLKYKQIFKNVKRNNLCYQLHIMLRITSVNYL